MMRGAQGNKASEGSDQSAAGSKGLGAQLGQGGGLVLHGVILLPVLPWLGQRHNEELLAQRVLHLVVKWLENSLASSFFSTLAHRNNRPQNCTLYSRIERQEDSANSAGAHPDSNDVVQHLLEGEKPGLDDDGDDAHDVEGGPPDGNEATEEEHPSPQLEHNAGHRKADADQHCYAHAPVSPANAKEAQARFTAGRWGQQRCRHTSETAEHSKLQQKPLVAH
ncbi:MAG: hypothetical protein FRX49_09214 [Trebouxia sp. A1-2]|nr:MAG: hypothetical protein FRX49_09214 [Trebouxia sp. A1-2]